MVDTDVGFGGDRWLRVKRHTRAGKTDHVEIVGAIADCDGIGRGQAETSRDFQQSFRLCYPSQISVRLPRQSKLHQLR